MSAPCPVCSSTSQVAMDATTVCMECATIVTPSFTLPLGLMLVGAAVASLTLMVVRKHHKWLRLAASRAMEKIQTV